MKMNIKATGIELTPAIGSYVEKRLEKLGQYLTNEDVLVSVEIGKTSQHHKHGDVFRAEVRVTHGGTNFYATSEGSDLYALIDKVRDEMVYEITKDTGKKRELLRRGQRVVKDLMRGFPWIKFRK